MPTTIIVGAYAARKRLSKVQTPAYLAVPRTYCLNCGGRNGAEAEFRSDCRQKLDRLHSSL